MQLAPQCQIRLPNVQEQPLGGEDRLADTHPERRPPRLEGGEGIRDEMGGGLRDHLNERRFAPVRRHADPRDDGQRPPVCLLLEIPTLEIGALAMLSVIKAHNPSPRLFW